MYIYRDTCSFDVGRSLESVLEIDHFVTFLRFQFLIVWLGGNIGRRPLGPKVINGLIVPSGKASTLLTGHLITG